ncbi:cupin domain-containing protein, partial [Burkholderia gladioli]|nr:cupin domain-containing protein [Burkholderia gladioli]
MDALSEVLSMLRVSSALSSRFEGRGAWAFHFPAYQHVKFGSVLQGSLHLWMVGETRRYRMEEGDFYLLTDGASFCAASDPSRETLDGPPNYRAARGPDGVVRWPRRSSRRRSAGRNRLPPCGSAASRRPSTDEG